MLHRFFSLVLRIRNPDPLDPQHFRVWIRILIDPQKKFGSKYRARYKQKKMQTKIFRHQYNEKKEE